YNGHPDYRDLEFDLTKEKVAIVGMGNVAVDVARILCRTEIELKETDIADYAFEKLVRSNIKEVYMLGRRGPAQAAFTNPELRELTKLEDADLITLREEVELDILSLNYLEKNPDRSLETKVGILKEASEKPLSKSKRLTIRFLVSPVEITGNKNNDISKIKLTKNELYQTDDGSIRPRSTDKYEELDVDIVFRSIGYHGIPLPGLPFNEKWGIIPNINGRITDLGNNQIIKGLYVTGWIKRGPSGVIGTNKTDSGETVKCMLEDIENGNILNPSNTGSEKILELIEERQPSFISYKDWLIIDEIEKKRGEQLGRPRLKFTTVEEILEALGKK
ncbi:MAG: NADP oxidoreductase, partial [Thermodesulfobacteriota bacterium]